MMARAFAGLAIVAGLIGAGWYMASRHYTPLLDAAKAEAVRLGDANQSLAASIKKQNQSIADLQASAKKREQAARQALESARGAAEKDFISAGSIMLQKAPVGAEKCDAARDAFAAELLAERGAK